MGQDFILIVVSSKGFKQGMKWSESPVPFLAPQSKIWGHHSGGCLGQHRPFGLCLETCIAFRAGLRDNVKGDMAWVSDFPFFHLFLVAHSMLYLFAIC